MHLGAMIYKHLYIIYFTNIFFIKYYFLNHHWTSNFVMGSPNIFTNFDLIIRLIINLKHNQI